MRSVTLLSASLLLACGGPPRSPSGGAAAAPGGMPDLAAQIEAKMKGPQSGDAVVTYAVFAPGAPEPRAERKLATVVEAAFRDPPPELAERVRRGGNLASMLSFTVLPVDAELPLNVEALAEEAGELAEPLRRAGQVAFIRYAAPPLREHAQIGGTAVAAVAIARALDAPVVVDLATLDAASPDALIAVAGAPAELKSHVRIVPELRAEDQVTLRSRGMAKFGKPDLEMGPLAPDAVKPAGARYMEALEAIFAGEPPPAPLGTCAGPAEAYDLDCVSLAP